MQLIISMVLISIDRWSYFVGHADLIYGQWSFSVHKKASTWAQATDKCKRQSGKLFEPAGEQGRALTSVLMVDQPLEYKMWIGMFHNDTKWNFSDANINETYDG